MIVGLIITVVGVIVFLLPAPQPDAAQGVPDDIAKVIEEIRKLLELFDKRFRPGLLLILVGLALIGGGIYLETRDVKDATEQAQTVAMMAQLFL